MEKRNCKRLSAKEGVFAVLSKAGVHYYSPGPLIDISLTGLGFKYLPIGEEQNKWSEVSIFTCDCSFPMIRKIPCRIVYSCEVKNQLPDFDVDFYRRCGVEFSGINEDHISKLREFIEEYTIADNGCN